MTAATTVRADSASGYFVDCEGGNDSAAGNSPREPWKTLGKVNSTVTAAGSDVFIKAGTTCSNQSLTVDWQGSAANRAIVSAYYVAASGAQQGYEGSSRPTIRGTYRDACRSTTPSTCPVGIDDNDRNATPVNQWLGLITVRTSYVTVQDLALADSSGAGLVHVSDGQGSHVIAQNLSITQTFTSGIRLERVKNDVLRNNTVDRVSLKKVDGRASNWPPGIQVTDSVQSHILIEGNRLSNSAGEGIGVLRSSHTTIRGNTVSNNRRPLIYLDNASDNVVEDNMLLGNGYLNGADESYGIGLSIAVEPYKRDMRSSIHNVFRNNLMANTRGCMNLEVFRDSRHNCAGGVCDDPVAKGYKVGALISGNTCLQDKGRYIASANLAVNDNIDKIEIVDNVFSTKAGNNCTLPSVSSSLLKVDSNVFGTAPSDGACRGTNSKVGDTGIRLDYSRVHAGAIPSRESFGSETTTSLPKPSPATTEPAPDAAEPGSESSRESSRSTCLAQLPLWARALLGDYLCESGDSARGAGERD